MKDDYKVVEYVTRSLKSQNKCPRPLYKGEYSHIVNLLWGFYILLGTPSFSNLTFLPQLYYMHLFKTICNPLTIGVPYHFAYFEINFMWR